MTLDNEQKKQVALWITEGAKISDIQKRLETKFSLRLTYMEVRFLMDDLKVMPKDPPPPPTPPPSELTKPEVKPSPMAGGTAPSAPAAPAAAPGAAGNVSLTVDQLAKPGALVSGSVTFSDGVTAEWYMDEMGRLGLVAKQKGYKPPAADVQPFQVKLQAELQRLGMY
jgi:hypothetical protein